MPLVPRFPYTVLLAQNFRFRTPKVEVEMMIYKYKVAAHLNGIQLILIFREYSSNSQFFTWTTMLLSSPEFQAFHSRWRPAQGDQDQENQQRMLHFFFPGKYLSKSLATIARPKAERSEGWRTTLRRVMNFEIVLSAKYLSFQPWKEKTRKANCERRRRWTDIFADTANVTGFCNDEKMPLETL